MQSQTGRGEDEKQPVKVDKEDAISAKFWRLGVTVPCWVLIPPSTCLHGKSESHLRGSRWDKMAS